MKNITKRGEYSFRVRVYANGEWQTSTFDTLRDAQIWRDKIKAGNELNPEKQLIRKARLRQREAKNTTIYKALEKYEEEITVLKKGAAVEKTRINKLKRTKFAAKSVYATRAEDVLEVLKDIGGSDNNKRKYASLISHMFTIAKRKWRWQVDNPVAGEITLPSNGKPRERRLEEGEETILDRLLTGQLRHYVFLAIETGMRRSELLNLEWRQIDLDKATAWLFDTKNGESRRIPLSKKARTILEELKEGSANRVFTITESQLRKNWERVRNEAGLGDLRIHDLRHEATSRFFEKGLNVIEASSITGHKSLTMLKRYTHLNPSELAKKLD